MAFAESAMAIDPHPSQQDVGCQHGVLQPQQEVTKPMARFRKNGYLAT